MTGQDGQGSRPHLWPCRHCDMVEDYRLHREAQLQLAEGVFRQDEDYRLATFKDWLRTFEWPHHDPGDARSDDGGGWDAQDWISAEEWTAAGWGDGSPATTSGGGDGRGGDEVAERREQLTRWHHDDDRSECAAGDAGHGDGEAMAS